MEILKTNLKYKHALAPLDLSKLNGIVLHHAEAKHCTPEDIHRWHLERGWAGAGYNYFVNKKGEIYELRGLNIGAQCKGYNSHTLGICAEGDYTTDTMPLEQKKAIIDLCKYLIDKYPQIKKLYKHKDLYPTSCPGDNYPFNEIVQAVFKPKYNANFCLLFQKWYNTLTKHKLVEDGIYGAKTEKAYESIKNILEDFRR